jgi:hypothetical protein
MSLQEAAPAVRPSALPKLAVKIRTEHAACERDARSAVEHAIRCGELLAEAKGKVKHREWLPWLAENFPATQQTANGYMRIASNYGTSRDLPASVNAALKELAVLEEQTVLYRAVEHFETALADGRLDIPSTPEGCDALI